MSKIIIIIFIFISTIFSSEIIKFVFWNSDEDEPIYGIKKNTVEYKLRVSNQEMIQLQLNEKFKEILPKKGRRGRTVYENQTYSVYTVETEFNELLIGDGLEDCESNKLYLDFKVQTGDEFYTGSQVLVGSFWDCQKIGSDQEMSTGGRYYEKIYFSNSEIINPGGGGKTSMIKIMLNSPKLKISGTLIDSKTKNKISSDLVDIYLNSEAEGNLSLQKVPSKDGEYIREVQLHPNATDVSSADYRLYFIAENYYSKFIDIDNHRLNNGKTQIKNIKLEPRYPFSADLTINPNPEILFYNSDCMKWMCKDDPNTSVNEQQTQIYIKKIDNCTDKCKPYERSQITKIGTHECTLDQELQDYTKESDKNLSYKSRMNACTDSILISLDDSGFKSLFLDDSVDKKSFEEICRKKISKNIQEDQKYQIFVTDFLDDYEGECEFGDYIEESLCDNVNKDIIEDYYYLIKLSDALYKNIRYKYNDNHILGMIRDNTNTNFNDIERLILLYNKIDLLEQANELIRLKSDHAGGDVPNYIYVSMVADHYLKRIEFYVWYLETIFYLYKNGSIKEGKCKKGANCHRVYDEENTDEVKNIDFKYLCSNYYINTKPGTYGTSIFNEFEKKLTGKLPTLKNIEKFIIFLDDNIKTEIRNYKYYSSTARRGENYQPSNIEKFRKKMKKIVKEFKYK